MTCLTAETTQAGIDHLLRECGSLRAGERVAVIADATTAPIGRLLTERALQWTPHVRQVVIPPLSMHGEEPPEEAALAMQEATLSLGVTAKSMAHTEARRRAASCGGRYLSLPDYSLALLCEPAVRVDYRRQAPRVRAVADAFTRGAQVEVRSRAGTKVTLNIRGRQGNCCPGFVEGPGDLGSPPDIEANVSPVETDSEGTIVVDGSIPYPGLGLLADAATRAAMSEAGWRLVDGAGAGRVAEVICQEVSSACGRSEHVYPIPQSNG